MIKKPALVIALSAWVCMAFSPYSTSGTHVLQTTRYTTTGALHEDGLQLRFRDAFTGISIIPERVQVSLKNNPTVFRTFSAKDIAANGSLWIPAPKGVYDVAVFAHDYKAMSTSLTVDAEPLNANFNLHPYTRPQEFTPKYLSTLHQDGAMIIYGYVVDDASGKPLPNVTVYTPDGAAGTKTQSNGYYRLALPLPHTPNEVHQRAKLVFKHPGYSTEIRENFDLYPQGDVGFKVRMQAGSGTHTEAILTQRPADITLINP